MGDRGKCYLVGGLYYPYESSSASYAPGVTINVACTWYFQLSSLCNLAPSVWLAQSYPIQWNFQSKKELDRIFKDVTSSAQDEKHLLLSYGLVLVEWRSVIFHRNMCRFSEFKYWLYTWSLAFSTITSTAIIFGKTTLHMPSSHLILIGIITPATGILGALLAPSIQAKIPYCSGVEGGLKMFKLVIGASCLIPAYVCSGVLFNTSTLGTEWEMYVLASVFGQFWCSLLPLMFHEAFTPPNIGLHWTYNFPMPQIGILYGAFQSYARSLFAELIPPRQEAKWYALFSITDKLGLYSCVHQIHEP